MVGISLANATLDCGIASWRAIVAVARKLAGCIRAAMGKHEHYTLDYRAAA